MKKAGSKSRLLKYVVGAALGLGAVCQPAGAAEGGAGLYLPGTFGPQTGILPEVGIYLTNYSYYYTASASRALAGGLLRLDFDLDVFSNFTSVTHVTDWTLWGAQYGLGVIVPVVRAEYDARIQIGALTPKFSDDNCGLGDVMVAPLLLGCHRGNSHFLGITNVYFPTGSYHRGTGVNLGKNRYAVEPALGYTYLNEENGREVSLGLGYTVNFKNTEIDYRTGDEFHADLVLAQHLPNGMMLGAAGYWYEQVTGDSGSGAILGDFKGRVYGLGPVVSYNTTIGDRLFAISFKYYWEFEAKNRLEGDAAFLQLTYQF